MAETTVYENDDLLALSGDNSLYLKGEADGFRLNGYSIDLPKTSGVIALTGSTVADVGNGLELDSDRKASVKIDSKDNVLSTSASGVGTTLALSAGWNELKTNYCLRLLGKDNAIVSDIDASEFVKDGMLDSVELSSKETTGGTEHYMVFTWNTDGGKKTLDVEISKFMNIYTASDGVKMEDNNFSTDWTKVASVTGVAETYTTKDEFHTISNAFSGDVVNWSKYGLKNYYTLIKRVATLLGAKDVENADPTLSDSFLMALADWGLSDERPAELPEPSLTENLVSSNYILNDGYVDESGTYNVVDTVDKIKDNLDKLSTVNFPWMIWGYDLDIPEYVKYRNGNDFVYLRSVQNVDTEWNVAESLVEDFVGKEIYNCRWNPETYKREYNVVNNVKIVSAETFTYGNNCTYSVPTKITDNDGRTYTFCGHTVTLHSKNLVTSTSDDGKLMRYTCRFNNSTKYSDYGNNQYYCSMIRKYINSRVGYSEFKPEEECGTMYADGLPAGANGLLTKFYKDTNFMKRIMNQVNRVWDYQNQSNPDICIDEMGLISRSYIGLSSVYYNTTYDTSIKSLYSSSSTDALRKKFRMNIDGSAYSSAYNWWLRSAYSSYAHSVGLVSLYGNVGSSHAKSISGCSPLVVLG